MTKQDQQARHGFSPGEINLPGAPRVNRETLMPLPVQRYCLLTVLPIVWIAVATPIRAQSAQPASAPGHDHRCNDGPVDAAELRAFSMRPVTFSHPRTEDGVVSPGTRYRAFASATGQRFRLIVHDRKTHGWREVRGLPFAWRPFTGLAWRDGRTLVFDRWSSPHVGVHYSVDVARGALVSASLFHEPMSEAERRACGHRARPDSIQRAYKHR